MIKVFCDIVNLLKVVKNIITDLDFILNQEWGLTYHEKEDISTIHMLNENLRNRRELSKSLRFASIIILSEN